MLWIRTSYRQQFGQYIEHKALLEPGGEQGMSFEIVCSVGKGLNLCCVWKTTSVFQTLLPSVEHKIIINSEQPSESCISWQN